MNDEVMVWSLTALCAAYALWRLVRWWRGQRGADCGCGDCPANDAVKPKQR